MEIKKVVRFFAAFSILEATVSGFRTLNQLIISEISTTSFSMHTKSSYLSKFSVFSSLSETNEDEKYLSDNANNSKRNESTDLELKEVSELDRYAFEDYKSGKLLKQVNRLFSTIEMEITTMRFKRKKTSLFASMALVGGTTVGAGILALPTATISSGLIPSSVLLILVWAYMCTTGLLIAEVNINLICRSGQPGLGLLKLIEKTLGKFGAIFSGLLYVFIHYALLVAYIAKGGEIIGDKLGMGVTWLGPVSFCTIFGSFLAFGSTTVVEILNSALTVVVLASFGLLLTSIVENVDPTYYSHIDLNPVVEAAPVMLVALVFHNVIPVVVTQLECNVKEIRAAIVGGSFVPLLMFLAWNAVILGSVNPHVLLDSDSKDPLDVITTGRNFSQLVSVFSEAAIITSFIGFVIGLMDFFTDLFSVRIGDKKGEFPLYLLVLGPSLTVSILNPTVFYEALDIVGTFGISLLFGVLPALMTWQQRYIERETIATLPLVPGGKVTLVLIVVCALTLMGQSVFSTLYH